MNIRKEIQRRLLDHPLYSQEHRTDPIIHCKLFHAYGAGTWYLSEYDGCDIAFGYVTGLTEDEWGYIAISDLEAMHIGGSIKRIECDLHFQPICFSKLRTLEGV
jgi:Protein of unknown function (DUF2958)